MAASRCGSNLAQSLTSGTLQWSKRRDNTLSHRTERPGRRDGIGCLTFWGNRLNRVVRLRRKRSAVAVTQATVPVRQVQADLMASRAVTLVAVSRLEPMVGRM